MEHTLELGSLYLNGKPTALETEYPPGQNISFGDAVPDMAISWVPVNGLLIANRCLLTNISWDDLNAQDLVCGKEIKLCGFRFRVRLLKVGDKEGIANEWDTALNAVGEDNALWNWDGIYFCGQDTVNKSEVCCVLRGYSSARFFNLRSFGLQFAFVGFRPALEPLSTDISALRLGQTVMAIGRDGGVVGELVDETQYDLIVRTKADGVVGAASFVAKAQNNMVAVARNGIFSIAIS